MKTKCRVRILFSLILETVIETKQGISPVGFEGIIHGIFSLFSFNVIRAIESAVLKNGIPPGMDGDGLCQVKISIIWMIDPAQI